MLSQALRSKIDALWDKFWSGGIANPLTAIEQISYLLFMRRLDVTDRERAENAKWLNQPYTSLFRGHEDCRWNHFRHLPADEMLAHVRDNVFPFIKGLGGEQHPFCRYMQDAVFIIPKASLLVEAVGIIGDASDLERLDRLLDRGRGDEPQGGDDLWLVRDVSEARRRLRK